MLCVITRSKPMHNIIILLNPIYYKIDITVFSQLKESNTQKTYNLSKRYFARKKTNVNILICSTNIHIKFKKFPREFGRTKLLV